MISVMIAEDELLVRMGLNISVPWENLGMEVVASVDDGSSAWEEYERLHPQIVLTDLRMPGMDGMELIRRVRESGRDCEIIVITCLEEFDILYQLMRLNVTGYLLKATMSQEDILAVLGKAKQNLAQHTSKEAAFIPAARRQTQLLSALARNGDVPAYSAECAQLGLSAFSTGTLVLVLPHIPEERPILSSSILQIFGDRLASFGEMAAFTEADALYFVLSQQGNIPELTAMLRELAAYVADVLGIDVRTAVCQLGGLPERLYPASVFCLRMLSNPYFYPDPLYVVGYPSEVALPLFEWVDWLHEYATLHAASPSKKGALLEAIDVLRTSIPEDRVHFEQRLILLAEGFLSDMRHTPGIIDTLRQALAKTQTAQQAAEAFNRLVLPSCGAPHPVYGKQIIETMRYIRCHSENNISLPDMAATVNLSPNYYALLFKQMAGCSFSEYIGSARIERACALLREGGHSVAEVSAICGFSDVTYFTRFFKQKVGMPPHQWRIKK